MHHEEGKSVNIQEIGESLINELAKELTLANDNAKMTEGAIKGIQLFFSRVQKAVDEQSNQSESAQENEAVGTN